MRPTRGSLGFQTGQDDDAYDNWISTLNASSSASRAQPGLPITESKTHGVTGIAHGYSQPSSPVFSRIPSMDRSQQAMDGLPAGGIHLSSSSGLHHVFLGTRPLSNRTPSRPPPLAPTFVTDRASLPAPLHESTTTVEHSTLR